MTQDGLAKLATPYAGVRLDAAAAPPIVAEISRRVRDAANGMLSLDSTPLSFEAWAAQMAPLADER